MSQSAVGNPWIDENHALLAACTTMTGLACITIVARIHARGWMTRSTDRDDYTIWVAMILSITGFCLIISETMSGTGRYGTTLPGKDLQRSLLLQFITQPVYMWSICFVKVSITLCLKRFSPSKCFSRFLLVCMAFFVAIALAYFISLMLQCQPLSMVWDPSIQGSCMPPRTISALSIINNSISLFVDLLLATLPILMIWKIQIRPHVKVAIGCVMGMGVLAAVTCAIRIHYVAFPTDGGDVLFDTVYWTIWTVVECNTAIIAASVPAILPSIKRLNEVISGISGCCSSGTGSFAEGKPQDNRQDIEKGTYRSENAENRAQHESSVQPHFLSPSTEQASRTNIETTSTPEEVELEDEDVAHMYATASLAISRHYPRRYSDRFLYATRPTA